MYRAEQERTKEEAKITVSNITTLIVQTLLQSLLKIRVLLPAHLVSLFGIRAAKMTAYTRFMKRQTQRGIRLPSEMKVHVSVLSLTLHFCAII